MRIGWRPKAALAPVRLVAARALEWLRMVAAARARSGECGGVRWRLRGLPDT
jgi:hypothetical protein